MKHIFLTCALLGVALAASENDIKLTIDAIANQIEAKPELACEFAKTYSEKATSENIVKLIDAVAIAAPEQLSTVAHCTAAVAPDAAEAINAALTRILNSQSSKGGLSSKDATVETDAADAANPLDFPVGPDGKINTMGPPAGAAGGLSSMPYGLPPGFPPVVQPPHMTNVNP